MQVRYQAALHTELTTLQCVLGIAIVGAPGRIRTGTPLSEAGDFKSPVSTCFTTGAIELFSRYGHLGLSARTPLRKPPCIALNGPIRRFVACTSVPPPTGVCSY